MKVLIRPTLFTLARLGLFLAVVAWVVGQWWDIEFLLHGLNRRIILVQSGVSITDQWSVAAVPGVDSGFLGPAVSKSPEDAASESEREHDDTSYGIEIKTDTIALIFGRGKQVESQTVLADSEKGWVEIQESGFAYGMPVSKLVDWPVPGVGVDSDRWWGPTVGVHFRNWLVTSTFLAFNLLLHFIYRKRPEAQPCES